MKDYTSNTPVFSDKIRILEVTDTGHADNANCPVKQLLQNTLILKNIIDAVTENLSGAGLMGNEEGTPNRLDAHIGDNEVHVTAEEKAGLEEVKENITEINSAMDQLKKSVADGKALIASAITSKGVSTTAGAEFGTMANNIKGISTTPHIESISGSGSYSVNYDDNQDRRFTGSFSVSLGAVAGKSVVGVYISDATTNTEPQGYLATRERRTWVSSWNQNTATVSFYFHWNCKFRGTMHCSVTLSVIYA